MFDTAQFASKDLEILVRTALTHGELSPGVAMAVEDYRAKSGLTAVEQRQLTILDSAIADGCIVPIQIQATTIS
ncbi:hypothetical protein IQ260_09205 [Leptolyngbya cf. ectocarpi LEGE 11479]|uniref:Uncharacterized protein n=1 Tax=Leptolyngbya cf. ectocarpi LEGE 11479 TaxID=1828722 RepID=A0A928X3B8_LEPEC|nr:hypothetical protein [Leptolyngbya ectocarpi]MBE9066829.1 hypothetical protein [Leptolyngbya cf. ectocarpi LEGE 11479]